MTDVPVRFPTNSNDSDWDISLCFKKMKVLNDKHFKIAKECLIHDIDKKILLEGILILILTPFHL